MKYYYNNVPGKGLCRNNLIYTSLINDEKTVFCKWYHNDSDYHKGKNEVVDPSKMQEKWDREIKYLTLMQKHFPEHVPNILDIDFENKKIFFEIQDVDMWEQAGCEGQDYSKVLPDWQEQMLDIFKAHQELGLYKYSLHPSSYFIVNGKMKSINYFFTYHKDENLITVEDVLSHISKERRVQLFEYMKIMNIELDTPAEFKKFQILALNSFSNNYNSEFIEKAKSLYV